MPRFKRSQIEGLKNYLYHSNVHDAKIEDYRYDRKQRIISIQAVNPIYGVRIYFTFEKAKAVLFICGNWHGSCDTIISTTVEEDYSRLQNCIQICGDSQNDYLYLVFQTFSGDELHIVSQEVSIEIN